MQFNVKNQAHSTIYLANIRIPILFGVTNSSCSNLRHKTLALKEKISEAFMTERYEQLVLVTPNSLKILLMTKYKAKSVQFSTSLIILIIF